MFRHDVATRNGSGDSWVEVPGLELGGGEGFEEYCTIVHFSFGVIFQYFSVPQTAQLYMCSSSTNYFHSSQPKLKLLFRFGFLVRMLIWNSTEWENVFS